MRDLVVLVPDNKAEAVIRTLLDKRKSSLRIHEIDYEIYRHPRHDPGVRLDCVEFLRPYSRDFVCAIVLFDYEGSGSLEDPVDLEEQIESALSGASWGRENVCAVIIDPELELWAWNGSDYTAQKIGWDSYLDLKNFLIKEGLWDNEDKPRYPKKAFEKSLRKKDIPLSASIYRKIAERTSLDSCQDRAFNKLKRFLAKKFPWKR